MHCQPTALGEVAPECIREGGTGNGDPRHSQVCSRDPAREILLLFGARHASAGNSINCFLLCGTRGVRECIASPRRSGKCVRNAFPKVVGKAPRWGPHPLGTHQVQKSEFCGKVPHKVPGRDIDFSKM